jgi:hypothetical protein
MPGTETQLEAAKKHVTAMKMKGLSGTPEWIRTTDLLLRRQPGFPNSLITQEMFMQENSILVLKIRPWVGKWVGSCTLPDLWIFWPLTGRTPDMGSDSCTGEARD